MAQNASNVTAESSTTACVGRFSFTLPVGWTVAHSQQALYRVELSSIKLNTDDDGQRVWLQKLDEIRRMARPPNTVGNVVREFLLTKETPAVWYYTGSEVDAAISLYAQRRVADQLITATRHSAKGSESPAQELVQLVLDAYRPGVKQGFCIGPGSFLSNPGSNETAEVTLVSNTKSDLTAKISTNTRLEPDPSHPLDTPALDALGPEIKSSQTVDQSVGPFAGKTKGVELAEPGKPSLLKAIWYYPGMPRDPLRPQIQISVLGNGNHRDDIKSAYSQLLTSLKPLPR